MSEYLANTGIYLDELNKICVLEPEIYQRTKDLKDECQDFVEKISDYQEITDDFIKMVSDLARRVEEEKIKAIGAQNRLKSVSQQREAEMLQLQALVLEKQFELQRLTNQAQSLQRVHQEQQNLLDNYLA